MLTQSKQGVHVMQMFSPEVFSEVPATILSGTGAEQKPCPEFAAMWGAIAEYLGDNIANAKVYTFAEDEVQGRQNVVPYAVFNARVHWVEGVPLGVFFTTGSPSLSNRIS